MPVGLTLPRLALIAACLTAPLTAQQLPLAVDPEWSELEAPNYLAGFGR